MPASPFDKCFSVKDLLILFCTYDLSQADLCALASTRKCYYDCIMSLLIRNLRLKDFTRVTPLSLLFKRCPTFAEACQSIQICETVEKSPDVSIYSQFINNGQVPVPQNVEELFPSQHAGSRDRRPRSYPAMHDDLAVMLETIAQYNAQVVQPRLNDPEAEYLGFRKFSWVNREKEEIIRSERIAKALSGISSNLKCLQLTIHKWELSFWVSFAYRTMPCNI